ncbi:GTPase HflX [Candidatus Bathyarchaeota archaeon]|nr:MAG: GTPase HflX [Candidatus Bathyarchaeota archaeon]
MRSIVVECVVPLVPSRADEVETMAKSIGYEVVDRVIQHRKSLHHTYCIGPGKLDEIKQLTSEKKIEAVLFANRLPGSQVFKIQKVLGGTEIKVIDRNMLILEVFDQRAMTKEAKLQIQLAKLRYTFSWGKEFLRLKGILGEQVGWSGPGEYPYSDYERGARRQISRLEDELENVYEKKKGVDYQNGADAFSFILIDSIGFIEDMHPIIIKAFNTTLGEISDSDLILLFIDISEDEETVFRKITASNETLKRIAPNVPLIVCVNKIDRCSQDQLHEGEMLVSRIFPKTPRIALSALKGQNTQEVVRLGYQQLNGQDGQKTLELRSSP